MNKDLQIFNAPEFGAIRALERDGQPWLVGKDVAEVLGYERPTKAIQDHVDDEDKDEIPIQDSIGRMQKTPVINESGLYSLVLGSKLPSAKKFKRWVTSEVLPSIRKHGAYMTPEKVEEVLLNPDTIIALATQLKEEREKRIKAEGFIHQIASSENSLLVREVAKIASKDGIVIGQNKLYDKLREWGLIFKDSTEPIQKYIDCGYFEVVEGAKDTSKGVHAFKTTRVTGKGQVYIINRLIKELKKAI